MKKSLIQIVLKLLLGIKPLRNRLIFAFKHEHFDWLDVCIPVSDKHKLVLGSLEAAESFSEVFVYRAYQSVLDYIDFPETFLDLGCHYGYFSLYMAVKAESRPLRGLLIDGDQRVRENIDKIITINPGMNGCKFIHGVLGEGEGTTTFYQRAGMGSSSDNSKTNKGFATKSNIISENDILLQLSPPYDLVKLDIEGGEGIFLKHYPKVLTQTKHLLIEWHSWNVAGLSQQDLIDAVKAFGFGKGRCLEQRDDIPLPEGPAQCAVYLFSRE